MERKRNYTTRSSKRRKDRNHDEDDVRAADAVIESERVFSPEDMAFDDKELYDVIRQSRDEYIQKQQQEAQNNELRNQRSTEFAMPLSRLNTWMRFSDDLKEKELLAATISMIQSHIRLEDTDTTDIIPIKDDLSSFLETLGSSKLYQDVSRECLKILGS